MLFLKVPALVLFLFIPGRLLVFLLAGKSRLGAGERRWLSAMAGTGVVSLGALLLGYLSMYGTAPLLVLVGLVTAVLGLAAWRWREGRWTGRAGRPFAFRDGDDGGRTGGCGERARHPVPGDSGGKRRGGVMFRGMLTVVVLASAGLLLYSPPWRIVFGWSDVGIYPNMAAGLARNGGFSLTNQVAGEVTPEHAELLYYRFDERFLPDTWYENQFYAFEDLSTGKEWPLFFHLWPSLMAVFASFLGLSRMFWAITWVAVLGLCGFYLLARRLVGPPWALAALALFLLAPLMLYFTRYTLSECLSLALFLGGGLCLHAYLGAGEGTGKRGTAALAAFLLGLGFLCRIDFLFLLVPLYLFFALKAVAEGWDGADRVFLLGVGVCAVLSVLAGLFFARVYFLRVMGGFIGDAKLAGAAGGVAVLAACLLAVGRVRGVLRQGLKRLEEARLPRTALTWGSLALLFVWLYFIRPRGASPLAGYGFIKAEEGPSYVNQSFLRWAWYLSPPGLALAFAGYASVLNRAAVTRRDVDWGRLALAVCGVSFTLLYALDMRALPMHILCMRRLVPVILPVGLMMMVWALRATAGAGRLVSGGVMRLCVTWGGRVLAASLFIYLAAYMGNASRPLLGLDESGNQWELCSAIAADVEEGGVVLLDYHGGDLFGSPLRCLFGVENAWLKEDTLADGDGLRTLLRDLGFPGRTVYLLWRPAMSGEKPVLPAGVEAEPAGEYLFREESLEKSFVSRPEKAVSLSESFRLYRLVGTTEQ